MKLNMYVVNGSFLSVDSLGTTHVGWDVVGSLAAAVSPAVWELSPYVPAVVDIPHVP